MTYISPGSTLDLGQPMQEETLISGVFSLGLHGTVQIFDRTKFAPFGLEYFISYFIHVSFIIIYYIVQSLADWLKIY